MATSAGELLDRLNDLAQISAVGRQTNAGASDAARALGHLGRALRELRRAGVAARVGDDRETLVSALAATCAEIAERSPVGDTRLCRTAGAAADAIALAGVNTTTTGRWAMTTELLDIVTLLGDVVGAAPIGAEIASRCAAMHEYAVRLQRDAAVNPPTPQHFEALDRPIPTGMSETIDLPDMVRESAARLIHASEQRDVQLTVAQVLARTIAAEALASAAEKRGGPGPAPQGHATASDSWRAVRSALRPFDDGSRRAHQPVTDPGTAAALRLHGALQRAGDPTIWQPRMHDAVAASLQLLPTHARQLQRTVHRWAEEGCLMAYACDLPYQDGRANAYLAGHARAGLIRVLGPHDLQTATAALSRTALLTAALAETAGDQTQPGQPFPRHLAASHRATIARTAPADISAAARRAYEQLRNPSATPPPRRTR